MDRSKTPTPAALHLQHQQQNQQHNSPSEQPDQPSVQPHDHTHSLSSQSSASADDEATVPSATGPGLTSSIFGFGWVKPAITSFISPLNVLASSGGGEGGPAGSPAGPHSSRIHHAHSPSVGSTNSLKEHLDDSSDDDDSAKRHRARLARLRDARASETSVVTNVSESDAEDSGNEEIFTPFHKIDSNPHPPPRRTHSPVSPANALKRLPFANHILRSSSPAPNPHTPGSTTASAETHPNSTAAQHNAAASPTSSAPRLFKPFARREALVLDESAPLDEDDDAEDTAAVAAAAAAAVASLPPQPPRPNAPGAGQLGPDRSQLPSLVLTPSDRVFPSHHHHNNRRGSASQVDGSVESMYGQQLSPDASFELESLEKVRIDMETPDNTNTHRELVAFGQAVADSRATPKPFTNPQNNVSSRPSPEEGEDLLVEELPPELRATPKPEQYQNKRKSQPLPASVSSPKQQHSSPGARARNIFRRSGGSKSIDLGSSSERRGLRRPSTGKGAIASADLSPTLLAEVDEPMEELGTPVSTDQSEQDHVLQQRQASEGKLTGATASSSGTDSPARPSSQASKNSINRSTSSSGSFWRFSRSGKKQQQQQQQAQAQAEKESRRSRSDSASLNEAPAVALEFPARSPAAGSSSFMLSEPAADEVSMERRGSILSNASRGGSPPNGGASDSSSNNNNNNNKVRISIDAGHHLPRRTGTETSMSSAATSGGGAGTETSASEIGGGVSASSVADPDEDERQRRGKSMESFRDVLSRRRSLARKHNASTSTSGRPDSVYSVASLNVGETTVSVKDAGKLSVKLWPKGIKTKFRAKNAKERDFERVVLAQELYLGWDPVPQAKRRPSEPDRRRSYNSSIDGSVSVPTSASSLVQSPASASSGADPISAAGAALGGVGVMHSGSVSSMGSAASSSAAGGASSASASGSMFSNGTGVSCTNSRPSSIRNGSSPGNNTKPLQKSTWAMRFSVDGKYFAVAGQDTVVRVYEVLGLPEQRQAEVDAALLATGHGLGAGGSSTSLNSNLRDSGLGYTDGGANLSQTRLSDHGGTTSSLGSLVGSKGRKSGSKAQAKKATNRAIPVFNSQPIREFRGHTADIIDLSWSKNNFLMSASTDKTARLWHVTRPECLCTFGHLDFVTGACFHPTDDRFFLSASLDGKLRLWNIPAKKVQYSQEVPGLITACAFTASGKMACAGTFGGAIVLYHTEKLAYATSIAVRSTSSKSTKGSKITGIEPIPNLASHHERILVSSNDSRIRIYDLGDKSVAHKFKASGYHNKVSQIRASVSTDGTYITAGSEDASVYVWDAAQGKAHGGLRAAGNKVSRNATKQFAEAAHEYWSTSGGTVTCALVAPLLTHKYLDASEDPIMRRSWRHEIEQARSGSSRPLSTLTLSSAVSAALPFAFRTGPGRQQVNARLNRIVITADDSSCVQVWRTDSFDLLGTIKQPMTPMSTAAAAASTASVAAPGTSPLSGYGSVPGTAIGSPAVPSSSPPPPPPAAADQS